MRLGPKYELWVFADDVSVNLIIQEGDSANSRNRIKERDQALSQLEHHSLPRRLPTIREGVRFVHTRNQASGIEARGILR